MRTQARLLALLFLIQPSVWGAFNSKSKGTTTANFLKLGVGARAVGMGEAYAAVADDATGLYWNPAALTRVQSNAATFMHAPYLASTFYDYGAYAHRAGPHAFGAGVQYFSAGSIDQTDENNAPLGHFNPYDLAASLGYAYQFGDEGASIGVVGKYIQSKIIDSATAFAGDVGVLSREYAERWRFAFTAVNIGTQMKFEEESEDLPLSLRLGTSLKLTPRWLSSADLGFPRDNDPYIALGTEYRWQATEALSLAGRLGYNSRTTGEIDGVTGVSVGTGFGFKGFAFDYAFLPYGGVGLTHRISLSFKWGESSSTESRPVMQSSTSPDSLSLDEILKKS